MANVAAVDESSAVASSVESRVAVVSRSALRLQPSLNALSRTLRRCVAVVDPAGAVEAATSTVDAAGIKSF